MLALDHIAFGARDVDAAVDAWARLGFTASARARCEWESAGTHAAAAARSVVFAQQYLDLIEIAEPRWRQHLASSSLYRRGLAPTGIVLSGIAHHPHLEDPERLAGILIDFLGRSACADS